ncbi:MAG TPA: hypothetical protein VN578_13685 [Candidatus Binatia bacterium]|jgi:hypothetical protein|nr:hypothetical protein [Candidatus Binatia bacterium]
MKTRNIRRKSITQRGLLPGFVSLALLCLARLAMADDLVVNSFDTAISGIDWQNFRSYAYSHTEVWDPNQDSTGNPSSGSMYLTVNWPLHSDPNWNQSWNDVQIAFYTPPFNPADYINFDVDVKIDVTNSFPAVDGTYGAIEFIVNNPWTTVLGWAPLSATNGWQHIRGYFSGVPAGTNSEAVIGLISNGGGSFTNTVACWIDNIVFTAPATVHTNRPALSIAPARPAGLTCVASQPGGTWQRQMVATVNDNYSWNTATAVSNTTTYSMDIAACPGTNYSGFQSQLYLVPKAGMIGPPIDLNIDWDSADVVDFYVSVNPDNTASGHFGYKVSDPSDGTLISNLVLQCASGPLGKWSLSFDHNTNVMLIAPNGTSTNLTIPASDAARFADPLFAYFGTEPTANANIGQLSTFSRISITGAAGAIDDNFVASGTPGQPYVLNTNVWAFNAADPNGVFITAPDAKYVVTWPLPDAGFTNLYATDNLKYKLGNSQWASLPAAATGWLNVAGVQRMVVVNQSALNQVFSHAPTNCFFGLFHQ